MYFKRRDSLKTTSALVSRAPLTSFLSVFSSCVSTSKLNGNNNKFGLQLYSLRDDLPKDPKGVLQQVASFGYKQLEGFEGGQGIFWGMKNTEFKSFIGDLGMKMVSSHCNYKENLEQ